MWDLRDEDTMMGSEQKEKISSLNISLFSFIWKSVDFFSLKFSFDILFFITWDFNLLPQNISAASP